MYSSSDNFFLRVCGNRIPMRIAVLYWHHADLFIHAVTLSENVAGRYSYTCLVKDCHG